MNYDKLKELLERHEGKRKRPYPCSAGKITIGIGHNLDAHDLPEDIIQRFFHTDINESINTCTVLFKAWQWIPDMKQVVLANMAFQLGHNKLSGFKKLIAAVNTKDWQEAAKEMKDSKWYVQSGNRSIELVAIMRNS